MDYKVDKVIIAHKDRLSRVGFSFFERLFKRFGTEMWWYQRSEIRN